MHDLEEKLKKVAEFFCEDKKKFKIEELFVRLLKLVEQLPVLAKVRLLLMPHNMHMYITYTVTGNL